MESRVVRVNVMGAFASAAATEPAAARPGSCGESCIDALRCRRDRVCWREVKAEVAEERTWTESRVLALIREHVAEHGEPPRCNEWERRDPDSLRPTSSTVARVFGSWNEAIAAAGVEPRPHGGAILEQIRGRESWTREGIIVAIQAWAAEHGAPPKSVEWQRIGRNRSHPNVVRVAAVFGSWAAGIEAAGFERPRQGRKRLSTQAAAIATEIESKQPELSMPERPEPSDASVHQERQQPPVVWAVKVPDTGLRYRTPDEAYVAADEIEYDGEQVAERARGAGNDDKAEQAWDAAHELAEKVRAAARAAAGEPEPEPEEAPETAQKVAQEVEPPDLRTAALGVIGALRTLLDAAEASLREAS